MMALFDQEKAVEPIDKIAGFLEFPLETIHSWVQETGLPGWRDPYAPCPASHAGVISTEALSGAFFFFVLGQTGIFAYGFLRIAKIHPLFCRMGILPRKHREKSYPQKLSFCIAFIAAVWYNLNRKKEQPPTKWLASMID